MKPGIVCTIRDQSPEEEDEETYHTSHTPAEEDARVERMRAEMRAKMEREERERAFEEAMAPDYSRKGIFVYHNCYRCDHGNKPCVQGAVNRCDNPRARND